MSALIREKLIDLAHNKIVAHDTEKLVQSGHSIAFEYLSNWQLHCEFKCDIEVALKKLINTGQVDTSAIIALNAFLEGYRLSEISIPRAGELIVNLLALLEEETRITDDIYLDSVVRKLPKYEKTKEAYREKLVEYGRTFE